ncbi:MAG: MgtC/SapB family protein [Chitinophagaceae bacterium]|nr:MgtC/SapB family protein [Chitinophagaceae bacterium]
MMIDTTDILKLLAAMLIGLFIGSEREYRNKPAGLRTLMLVTLGSCIFTILSLKIGTANPDRLAANIITGIGFLGAGAIFKDENKINGLTTATTIWVCAALGMAVGADYFVLAFAGTVITLVVLSLLVFLENFIDSRSRSRDYRIVCSYEKSTLHHYEKLFKNCRLHIVRGTQTKTKDTISGRWRLSGSKKAHETLTEQLLKDEAITELDF